MQLFSHRAGRLHLAILAAALCALCGAARSLAITVGQVDDFQDGTTQGWGFGAGPIANVSDAGPAGVGDNAVFMDTSMHGGGKLVFLNNAQWLGNWTAAGVTQVSIDLRNPTATPFSMRLGIAGPGGAGSFGDVYVTAAQTLPGDNNWYSLTFDVLAEDFVAAGSGADIEAALAGVTQLRFLNNAFVDFTGQNGGSIYADNIHALGASVALEGDHNGDGMVDAADYVLWRKDPSAYGDAQGYDDWRANFGAMADGGHVHEHGVVAGVPEPASLLLIVSAFFFFAGLRPLGRRGKGAC